MASKHTITSLDKWFLDRHMKDPVTQEPFKVGDCIIICANCKTAHYEATWGMNPSKCCSSCESNSQLHYSTFSSAIFQHRSTSSRFSIVAEKLSFIQRLRLFNGYPIANTITVLIPILLLVIMFAFGEYRYIAVFQATSQLTVTKGKVESIGKQSLAKLSQVAKKPKSMQINGKLSQIAKKPNSMRIDKKLNNLISKIDTVTKHAGIKISHLPGEVVGFFRNFFGS